MKKSLLALAMSLAAASGAHASYWSGVAAGGNTANQGNGEMFLVLWDDVAKNSYIQDTGILFDALRAGTVNTTIALDTAALSTAFGGNYTNVRWAIGAASNHYLNADQSAYETQYFGMFSSGSASSIPAQTDGEAQIGAVQVATQIFSTISAFAGGAFQQGTQADNGVDVSVNNAPDYLGGTNLVAPFISNQPGVMGVANEVNKTTNLWYLGFNDSDALSPVTEIRGLASLNIAGANGSFVLAQSSTPEVPVPAAVWLLGSALAGLGGIARKRKSA